MWEVRLSVENMPGKRGGRPSSEGSNEHKNDGEGTSSSATDESRDGAPYGEWTSMQRVRRRLTKMSVGKGNVGFSQQGLPSRN